jgi:hypothetical protein
MKLLVFLIPLLLRSQDGAALTLSADAPATLEIDGAVVGPIVPGKVVRVPLPAGEHQLVFTPPQGEPLRRLIFIASSGPNEFAAPLREHLLAAQVEKQGYWSDERTGKTWAAADNGSGVTVSQARAYCRQLTTGGFHDWRLPEIDELQPLFRRGEADDRGYRLVAPLKLSGWAWSATQGNEPAENWALDLGDGARASVAAGDAGLNRALCVRSAGAR